MCNMLVQASLHIALCTLHTLHWHHSHSLLAWSAPASLLVAAPPEQDVAVVTVLGPGESVARTTQCTLSRLCRYVC